MNKNPQTGDFLVCVYFSNSHLSGKRSARNFALFCNVVSFVSRESFMQNVGACNNELRADWASVQ